MIASARAVSGWLARNAAPFAGSVDACWVALRCHQVVVKGLRILERENRQIDHCGPPLFAVGQRKLKAQAADSAQIVGGVGVAAAQGKAADHRHAAAPEDDSLRERAPCPLLSKNPRTHTPFA